MPATQVCEKHDVDTVDLWLFVESLFTFLGDIRNGTRLILTYEDEPVAAVVSIADLEKLNKKT